MVQSIDTNWHTFRIAFVSSTSAMFQVDANSWEPLTTGIPTISLKPWLFALATSGNTTTMDVSSVMVRKYANPKPTTTIAAETTVPATTLTPIPTPTPAPTAAPSAPSSRASPAPSSCHQTPPGTTAPWLYAAVPQDAYAILLSFTDASPPFDHYSLRYGTASGNDQFGVDRFGSVGARTELVSDLSPSTTYFFSLRAGNGCATGPWSNEIAATTLATNASRSLNPQIIKARALPETTNRSRSRSSVLTSTPEKRDQGIEGGYGVIVRVTDLQGNPVVDATVTLHSNAQTAITDQHGVAQFKNVAKGQHELLIADHGQTGTQSLYLTGDHVQTFQFTVKIQTTSPLTTPPVIAVLSALVLLILGVFGVMYRSGMVKRVTWQKIK
jgi:hypothetical protein